MFYPQAAGARVIPILYDQPAAEVRRIFGMINGVLIPGGGANLTPGHQFYDTARQLVELAIDANDNGDYFPVSGTSFNEGQGEDSSAAGINCALGAALINHNTFSALKSIDAFSRLDGM